jgi:hypothetical protein
MLSQNDVQRDFPLVRAVRAAHAMRSAASLLVDAGAPEALELLRSAIRALDPAEVTKS